MKSQLRLALVALGGVLALLLTAVLAYQLAAARVPQHRAALEELIRHETGLEVSFSELSVRWGWYGPEAVFHGVELGEPEAAQRLLRAPRLIVGLDPWRMVRSGAAGGRPHHAGESRHRSRRARAGRAAAARAAAPGAGTLLMPDGASSSRWRGGRIDIEGGTLTLAALTARRSVDRHHPPRAAAPPGGGRGARTRWCCCRRAWAPARTWPADDGDPALPEARAARSASRASGSNSPAGTRWSRVRRSSPTCRRRAAATSSCTQRSTHGRMLSADGEVQAQALEWDAPRRRLGLRAAARRVAAGAPRRAWHLSVQRARSSVRPPCGGDRRARCRRRWRLRARPAAARAARGTRGNRALVWPRSCRCSKLPLGGEVRAAELRLERAARRAARACERRRSLPT